MNNITGWNILQIQDMLTSVLPNVDKFKKTFPYLTGALLTKQAAFMHNQSKR